MQETVEIEKLREVVVSLLDKLEKEDRLNWWEDKEIIGAFDQLFTSGVILLPLNVVERVRWIALVCIEICKIEGFSYGNVLNSADYVPDEGLPRLIYSYSGDRAIYDIPIFRKKLTERGWKSLL